MNEESLSPSNEEARSPSGSNGNNNSGRMNNNSKPPPTLWNRVRLIFFRIFDRDKEDSAEGCRVVRAGGHQFNAKFPYSGNAIKTSRYTLLTFIPLNLLEQFLRIANCYFFIIVMLQCIPMLSPLGPYAQGSLLAIVMGLTALKYGVDDIFRHRSDRRINNRPTAVLASPTSGGGHVSLTNVKWRDIKVGQIVALKNNEVVPADMLLLSSSEGTGLCYVETAELDGETNLKIRQSLEVTQTPLGNDLCQLAAFNGEVQCEPPSNHLTRFDGCLLWQGEKYSLNMNNLLLRGFTVRNTQWAFGLVIYAGRQTKLMKNTGKSNLKRTRIDKLSNKFFFGIFGLIIMLIVIATVLSYTFENGLGMQFRKTYSVGMPLPPSVANNAVVIAVLQMWAYLILLQTLVPIALYLTFETIQALLSRGFINADLDMYHAATDSRAEARTTTLSEDLGQIEYIFSDKTGTLTQNVMTFNRCSIAGRKYGRGKDGERKRSLVDFSKHEPRHWELSFRFYDGTLLEEVQCQSPEVCDFFLLLCLCHTINAETDEFGKLTYKAQSPDEAALVGAARNFGFVYKSRTQSSVTVEIFGTEVVYDLLSLLEFDTQRKRMSIIVTERSNYGRRRLFCKGADNTILPLVRYCEGGEDAISKTKEHLHEFASEGLRTLCCAARYIEDNEWHAWLRKYREASTALDDREGKLAKCYAEIERNLTLLGATAVEDKLQDGVPQTISKICQAGIKIWVLTGDKQETAINIGHSCNVLNDDTRELIVDAEHFRDVEQQLLAAKQQIADLLQPVVPYGGGALETNFVSIINVNGVNINLEQLPQNSRNSVLIINGHSLHHALTEELEDLFLNVACACQAVICCRAAPLQKGRVVELVKRKKRGLTLAIGDGGNDVSMIKTAHIGVGISGQEGRQAVLASDFSLAQFRFLQKLLLVHGRRSYFRVAVFMRFFFYKTFAFTLCNVWYGAYCGWSATSIYDSWFIMAFNLIYTSTPVLYYAICEQDVSDHYSLKFPNLYQAGIRDFHFNWRCFLLSEAEGAFSSAATFYILRYGFGDTVTPTGHDITTSRAAVGIAIGTAIVIVVTIRCSIETSYWTLLNFTPILSIGTAFLLQFAFAVIFAKVNAEFENFGVVEAVWSSPSFWLSCTAAVAICCLPIFTIRLLLFIVKPSLLQRVQILRMFEDEKSWIYRLRKRLSRLKTRIRNDVDNSRQSMRTGNRNPGFQPGPADDEYPDGVEGPSSNAPVPNGIRRDYASNSL